MGESKFRPASREATKLRMSIAGPSGSGKTFTALLIATELAERVAVIDTEHASVDLYADRFQVDVAPLTGSFHPERYIELLMEAYEGGYGAVVIDSLSHAWNGPGGILSIVDDEVARSKSGNSFQAWAKATPVQDRLVQKLLGFPGHLIFTMRSKTEWIQETNERGKLVPRKIGLAPVQRDGIDYEVSVHCEMDQTHTLIVTKSRYSELADAVVVKPGKEFAAAIKAQLGNQAPQEQSASGNDNSKGKGKASSPGSIEGDGSGVRSSAPEQSSLDVAS